MIQDHVRTAIKLRYRLMPYLYACFLTRLGDRRAGAAAAGLRPPVRRRPSATSMISTCSARTCWSHRWSSPGSPPARSTCPAATGTTGTTGELVGGGRFVVAATPMDRIPIYARGGAVIPMWPEAPASTDGYHPAVVELHLFVPVSDGASHSMLQEDDGLTFAAVEGARFRTDFTVTRAGHRVDAARRGGRTRAIRNSPGSGSTLVLHGSARRRRVLDGAEVSGSDGRFEIPNTGSGFDFELTRE